MPKAINIPNWWTKMLSDTISRNKLPPEFLSIAQNCRIKDWCLTKRPWTKTKVTFSDLIWNSKRITFNKTLYIVVDNHLYKVNLADWTKTDIWSIWTTSEVTLLNYGKYIMIFTWLGYPYVYDGTTLTQTTSATCPDANPIIADKFTWFTLMFGNKDWVDNFLYISRPITVDNPERCYDWVWTNSDKINYSCKWLWIRWTMSKAFIFTEDKIEYIDKNSLQTIWTGSTLISTPIGSGGQPASQRSIVAAWSMIFYLTKNNTINTVDYAPGTIEPAIGTVTNQVTLKITKYLSNLDKDQSQSFGSFNENTKEISWFLKKKNSLYNDTTLVYDLENKTRAVDKWKLFDDMVTVWSNTYACSSINASIIEDWIWLNDDNNPIEFMIQDTDFMAWTLEEKTWSWRQTSGWLNENTNFEFRTLIDDNVVNLKTLSWSSYSSQQNEIDPSWIGDKEIGWWPIAWDLLDWDLPDYIQFDHTLDHWNVYQWGKRMKRLITENSLGSDFYLDFYTVFAEATWNIDLSDKR